MTLKRVVLAILALLLCSMLCAVEEQAGTSRESILDKQSHIYPGLAAVPAVPPLCEQLPALKKRYITIKGARLYVEEEGQGMPIVLLHGGPECTHQYFHPSCSRLAQCARVIYYDRRGCGQSSYTPGPDGYTIDEAVNDLEQLRKTLKIDRWVVLGSSFGGFLAQCYAVKYPDHFAGLILVDALPPAAINEQLQPTRQGMFITREEQQRIKEIGQTADITLSKLVYNRWLNGDWKRQNFYRPTDEEMARVARYRYDDAYGSHMMYTYAYYRLRDAFAGCPIPTLIVEGEWDLTWNTDKPAKMQAFMPKATLAMFPRSGHLPFNDELEKFTQLVQGYIGQLPKVPRAELAQWKASLRRMPLYDRTVFKAQIEEAMMQTRRLAEQYSASWLTAPPDDIKMIKTAMGLYDANRLTDSLAVWSAIKPDDPFYMHALVWRGQLLDLLHRRDEALACYRQALEQYHDGDTLEMAQYRIIIDRRWIAARINKPFTTTAHNLP